MTPENLLSRLQYPTGKVNAILDTDTYNEIDDQYALAYFLKSSEKINPLAVYAAPFSKPEFPTPALGMERSYEEILNIMNLCNRPDVTAYRGSINYLPDEKTPVDSPAARDLITRAMSSREPLYVLAIGAITNVASAILLEPEIINKIVVVWLGGHAHYWPPWGEYNMAQDVAAGRVIFGCGVPLVQLPCMGVVSHLSTTEPELKHHLKGTSPLGDYLYDITCREAIKDGGNLAWSRVIWDISVVAWLLGDMVLDTLTPAPIPSYDQGYIHHPDRHLMKVAYHVNRDRIFLDLYTKLK
ncbi:MAG: nucleoside hydrolase [Defluviitaleaceae bacterium]|nr:nucleoside hydrolase [Defluviitaleaceae bacterium]